MKRNYTGKAYLKEFGPVWKVKIGIHSAVTERSIRTFDKAKKLKMKIILN